MLRLYLQNMSIAITNAAAGDSSQGITLGAMTAACLVTLVAVVGVVAIIVNVTHTRLKVLWYIYTR